MKPYFWTLFLALITALRAHAADFLPGNRVLLDAHNCYPYKGQWSNRVDRALATGFPVAIEMDLIWDPGINSGAPRIIVSHGGKATGEEPSLRDYFFEKIRPAVEKALREGDKKQWPLITLNINDLRAEEPRFFPTLWQLTGEYEAWLCTAPKTESGATAPIDVKPVLILTSDGARQEKAFYSDVSSDGRLRMFASGTIAKQADNFRRWVNFPWKEVEPEGQTKAGDWSAEDETRLKLLVERAHKQGYWIRFYTLNGHGLPKVASEGWLPIYNFGSLAAVEKRWKAVKTAGVDFVASDQYEACARALNGN